MLGFVPACAKPAPRTGTSVCAKSKGKKKGGRSGPRGRQKYGAPSSDLKNFVSVPDNIEDDLADDNITMDPIKSKLSPLTGSPGAPAPIKKKDKGGEEPQAITIAKQATWVGIGSLVAVFLYVHLVAVGDWLPPKN